MRLRKILIPFGAAALALTGCESTLGVDCETLSVSTAGMRGDTVVTSTGLRYIELQVGTGEPVRSCQRVTVQYVARVQNGAVFEESTTELLPGSGTRTPGFEQGLIGVRVGGSRRLIVPPGLGYGATERRNAAGQVIVPANSTLLIDLLVIEADE